MSEESESREEESESKAVKRHLSLWFLPGEDSFETEKREPYGSGGWETDKILPKQDMVSKSSAAAADQLVCLFFYVSVWFSFGRTVRNQKSRPRERERETTTLYYELWFLYVAIFYLFIFYTCF